MNSNNKNIRSQDTVKLLDYGFAKYQALKIYSANEIIGNVSFKNATTKDTPLIIKDDVYMTVKKGETIDSITKEITLTSDSAPLTQYDCVGKIIITNSNSDKLEVDILVGENVEFLHWYKLIFDLFFSMLF